jgi:endonuclease/exonuclease/phosphatase family metal-dependent hydrolase
MAWPDTLTLVTLNTWKSGGDYPRRLALMGEQLAALAPNLLVLQEVFAAPEAGAHTGDALAAALGMSQIHEPARPGPRRHGEVALESTSGLSLLSRRAIGTHQRLTLPPDASGEKVALIAGMEWSGRRLGVIHLHLTYQPDAHSLRRRQLEEIVKGAISAGPFDAIVLAGDFNAEPDSPPLRWLQEASGFSVLQAWDAVGAPQPTMTEPAGSSTIGSRCVDHIVLLQPPGSATLRFVAAERVLDRVAPESGILPSDHAGLRAVLSPAVQGSGGPSFSGRLRRPSASLGSNQVDLGGITSPASATAISSSRAVG